jgi:mRNA interferase HigB
VNFCFILAVRTMNVRLVKKKTIEDYVKKNARSKPSFQIWLSVLKFADWNKPSDIIETYGTADIIGNARVVFNIGGNHYRMICSYSFQGITMVHLYIKWIGTHAEYSKLCNNNLQYTINIY